MNQNAANAEQTKPSISVKAANDNEFLTLTQSCVRNKQQAGDNRDARLSANKAILENLNTWRAQIEHENARIEEQLKREQLAEKLMYAHSEDEAQQILNDFGYAPKSTASHSGGSDQFTTASTSKRVGKGGQKAFRYVLNENAANVTKDDKPGYVRLPTKLQDTGKYRKLNDSEYKTAQEKLDREQMAQESTAKKA